MSMPVGPPFEGVGKGGADGAARTGMPCTTCPHPTCPHSVARTGVMPCPDCSMGGTLVSKS
eukprot:scaffold219967_cov18-Tisochrysis_lutea.AAC.2